MRGDGSGVCGRGGERCIMHTIKGIDLDDLLYFSANHNFLKNNKNASPFYRDIHDLYMYFFKGTKTSSKINKKYFLNKNRWSFLSNQNSLL